MPALDSGFKIATRTSGCQLSDIAIAPFDDWMPIVSEVQTAERFADRAFRARRGRESFVVYFEAYTHWRKEAPWNLLAKSGLLSERERLPTVCLVYIRHGQTPQWAVSFAAGAITAAATDTIVRADLLTKLAIFGKLAYKQLDVVGLIGREQMKESPLYEEIKDEGRLEIGQADVLAVLEERFGDEAAAEFSDAVPRVSKLAKLDRLHRMAIRCNGIDEFQRALRAR